MPKFLIFSLELSDDMESDIMKYRNLEKLKNDYKHLIVTEFEVFKIKYALLCTINIPKLKLL